MMEPTLKYIIFTFSLKYHLNREMTQMLNKSIDFGL